MRYCQKKYQGRPQHISDWMLVRKRFGICGSLGARTINEIIRQSYDLVASRRDIQVLWQIGKLYAEKFLDSHTAKLSNVKAFVFIDRMDMAYAIADVVIARAGAITISELCLTGKAAILIPSPHVAEDHQTHNARSLTHLGAAVLIPDATRKTLVKPCGAGSSGKSTCSNPTFASSEDLEQLMGLQTSLSE